jgi:L-lactate dehydrogenase complex protein LldG
MSPRQAFLQRVKQAVAEGNRAGVGQTFLSADSAKDSLADRNVCPTARVGYQGGGPDPVERFCQELAAAGGKGFVAANADAVMDIIRNILQTHNARKILLSRGGVIARLSLPAQLKALGMDAKTLDDLQANPWQNFFAADVGITNVHRLIAETGTVVLATKPDEPRSASLLPPVHIALAERSQLLPDLFDLFDLFSPTSNLPPSCLSLITGPSKTGDIELKLVTGVHGPGEIHVILCDSWI